MSKTKSPKKTATVPQETEEQRQKREYETLLAHAAYDPDDGIRKLCKELREGFEQAKKRFMESTLKDPVAWAIEQQGEGIIIAQELVRLCDEVEFKRSADATETLLDSFFNVYQRVSNELLNRTHNSRSTSVWANAVSNAKGDAYKMFYDKFKAVLVLLDMKNEAVDKLMEATDALKGVMTVAEAPKTETAPAAPAAANNATATTPTTPEPSKA